MNKKYVIITFLCILLSFLAGIITKDLLVGGTILATGLLCSYFAGEGRKITYIYGFINYVLMGYVSFKNHLYGIFFAYLFIFSPLQIHGFLNWKKNVNQDESVVTRAFTLKNSFVIVFSCILGSALVGFLLSLLPGQQLAFLDATSNCVNLCGIILLNLRFKEAWWLWLVNNLVDLSIWIIVALHQGEGSMMMLLVSIGYLLLNIYGIVQWSKAKRKQI